MQTQSIQQSGVPPVVRHIFRSQRSMKPIAQSGRNTLQSGILAELNRYRSH